MVAETDILPVATIPALLRGLSPGATVHSLASDPIVAMTEFYYARDGEIVTFLDPYYPDELRGSDPDALGDHLHGLYRLAEAGESQGDPAAVALLIARCPAALSMAWWNGEHQILYAPEPPDDPPDPDSLHVLLDGADPAARRRALFDAVDEVLAPTGLAGESWVIRALAGARTLFARADDHPSVFFALGTDQPQPVSRLQWRTRPRRPGAPPRQDDPLWHRGQAGRALHQLIFLAGTEPALPAEIDDLGHVEAAAHRAWPQVLDRIRATIGAASPDHVARRNRAPSPDDTGTDS